MRLAKRVLWYLDVGLLLVLAINTGLVKLGIGPAEGVEADRLVFENLGFLPAMTMAFGVVQIGAGLALLPRLTRRAGAGVLLATFVVATLALFVSGVIAFGFASIFFFVLAAVPLAWPEAPATRTHAAPGSSAL